MFQGKFTPSGGKLEFFLENKNFTSCFWFSVTLLPTSYSKRSSNVNPPNHDTDNIIFLASKITRLGRLEGILGILSLQVSFTKLDSHHFKRIDHSLQRNRVRSYALTDPINHPGKSRKIVYCTYIYQRDLDTPLSLHSVT